MNMWVSGDDGEGGDVGITMQEAAEGLEFVCREILADPFLRTLFLVSRAIT